jgi:hypothetical protein
MARVLAVAGVLGAGSALVLWAAFAAFAVLPSDRLLWMSADVTAPPAVLFDRGPLVVQGPFIVVAPTDRELPNRPIQPWQGPTLPGPGNLVPPPVLIDPAFPDLADPPTDG